MELGGIGQVQPRTSKQLRAGSYAFIYAFQFYFASDRNVLQVQALNICGFLSRPASTCIYWVKNIRFVITIKDFRMASPDTKTVRIDVDDPPVHTGDEESDRLFVEDHRTNAKRKIDYVLVYETCQEEEDKIPAFKERARNHENMRKRFETSLKDAVLELDSPDPQETSRDLVSRF